MTLGDQGKGVSAKTVKTFSGVPHVVHVKGPLPTLYMTLIFSQEGVNTQIYTFGEDLGDKVKVSSPKKLKF